MGITITLVLLISLFASIPIAFCLGITALVGFVLFTDTPLSLLANTLFHAQNNYTLIAVPLFFLAGNIMAKGALSPRLIAFARALTGQFPGGLGIAGVVACGIFGTITGSSATGLVAIGAIMYPAMVERGYDKDFSIGLLTTSGSLGIMIPPSVAMIVYACIANESVARIFLGGVGPGILMVILLSIYAYWCGTRRKYPTEKFSFRVLWVAIKRGVWALLMPVIVLGGIYGGIFTVTEAAGISAMYAFIVEGIIYRKLGWKDLIGILDESALFCAAIMLIYAMASVFGQLVALEEIPKIIAEHMLKMVHTKWGMLVLINCLLLFVGTFMDIISAILILSPIFITVLRQFDVDLIHFGVMFVFNMEIGFMTPPLGLNLMVASLMTGLDFGRVAKACIPSLLIMLVGLIVVTFWPPIVLWFPNWVYGP